MEPRALFQTCLILLLVDLLVFPPGTFAAGITWIGGTGNYTDTSWACSDPGCTSPTYPNNGNLGLNYDAVINSGTGDTVALNASGVAVNSMTIGGSGPSLSSTLNVTGGNSITFGTPSVNSGNVLAISNGGVLNVNSGGNATIELSGGAQAWNDTGGQINVTDGGTLTLQNTNGGSSTFTNNGTIGVAGTSSAATLNLNGNGSSASFNLTGNGTLTLGGLGQISGQNGSESLLNDVNHTIAGSGAIFNLANATNSGTLQSLYSGQTLALNTTLTNWSGASNTLTGGNYAANDGSILQLSSIGSNTIQTLSANVTINGAGLLTGDGTTNALANLTSLADGATLTLNNSNLSVNPSGGVFTLDPSALNLNGSSLSIAGPVDNAPGSTINLTFSGTPSTLAITGALNNEVGSSINLNGGGNAVNALGFTNSGSLFIAAGDTADFRSGSTNTFSNLDATGSLNGGDYDISGKFAYDATTGTGGGQILALNGANLTLSDSGQIVYGGAQGSAGSNALGALTAITGTDQAGSASLSLNNYTLNLPNDLANTATSSSDGSLTSSAIFLAGANLTANNLSNAAIDSSPTGAAPFAGMLVFGSTLTATGNLTNTANVTASVLGSGVTAGILLHGSSLTVGGTLTNSLLGNPAGCGCAAAVLDLQDNSTVSVAGLVDNTNGTIFLNGGGNILTGGGFTNTNGVLDVEPGDTADFRKGGASGTSTDTFTNLDGSTGTLGGGGTFTIGGTFLFDPSSGPTGGNILAIGAGTTLELTDFGAQVLYGPGAGTDALANFTQVAGTLNFYNDASPGFAPNGGVFTINSTGAMNVFDGATPTINGSLLNNGTVGFGDTSEGTEGILTINGDLTNNGAFVMADGNFSGVSVQGNLNNAGTLTVGDGNFIEVNGALTNAAGATLNVNGSYGGTSLTVNPGIDNAGALNLTNSSFSGSGGSVTAGGPVINESTGTIMLESGAFMSAPGFTNNGTLSIQAGGTADFRGGAFTNLSGGTLTGGTYVIGGTFQFDGGNGVINNIAAGTSLTLDGQNGGSPLVLSGDNNALVNLTSNAGKFTLTNGVVFATDTTSTGGTFTNTGTLTTTGTGSNAFNVTGNIFNTSPGVINLAGDGDTMTATGQFVNSGTVTLSGNNASLSSTGDFTNTASGIVSMTGSGEALDTLGDLNNAGTITIGAGDTVTVGGDYIQTAGTTTVDGLLTAGTVDLQGGMLTGGGEINGNLTVDGGTLSPGDPQSITIDGDYVQTLTGILDLDLASSLSYDHVNVGGGVNLDGILELTLEAGFDAALGTTFDIMNWNGPEPDGTGDFATFIDPVFDNGALTFEEVFNGNELDLVVVAAAPTPEPSALAMMFCAVFMGSGIAWRIRRRRAAVIN